MNTTQIIIEFIKTTFSAATLIIAIYGINTWRKQLKGTNEFELSKEILENVYKVKRAFAYVRNPGIYKSEYPKELQDILTLNTEQKAYATQYYYNKRLEILHNEFEKLENSFLKGIVLFNITDEIILPLRKCRASLIIALQDLYEFTKNPEYMSSDRIHDVYKIIYDNLSLNEDDKDQFSKYVIEAVDLMIHWLKPMLLKSKINNKEFQNILRRTKSFEIIIRNDV